MITMQSALEFAASGRYREALAALEASPVSSGNRLSSEVLRVELLE